MGTGQKVPAKFRPNRVYPVGRTLGAFVLPARRNPLLAGVWDALVADFGCCSSMTVLFPSASLTVSAPDGDES